MIGYKFFFEKKAIMARNDAANFAGLPVENGTTIYWVDFSYSEPDKFWYIEYVDGLENVLGQPEEFEIISADTINE